MKSRIVFICVLITTLLALPLWSQLTTGPVSPYYIVSLGGIYVVQGTNPVWSFPTVYGGGVKVAKDAIEAVELARKIMGMKLITHQTGPEGRVVQRLLIEETLPIDRELYLGI